MDGRFAGKVAIVTGSGSGVGRATALRFAADGAAVVVADIDPAAAAGTVDLIAATGAVASATTTDVSDEPSVKAMVAAAVARYGRLDVIHNNAAFMGGPDGDLVDLDVEMWDRKMAVNARGTMLGCKHAVPALRAAGGGAIVNTTSVSGLIGVDENAAYGSSKAAIVGLTRFVATMYGRDAIRCNAVAPGLIMTEGNLSRQSPYRLAAYAAERLLPWAAQPEDIAGVVTFLASDEGRCITGQTIVVDSGTLAHRPRHAMKQWEQALREGGLEVG